MFTPLPCLAVPIEPVPDECGRFAAKLSGSVHNAAECFGSVLGSAGIAVLMQSLLGAHLGFATAMAWSLWLPAAVLVTGLIAVLNFHTPGSGST
jgi:hypothetical protein